MTFDYTHGKEVKYMVMYHRWNGYDRCLYSSYKEAKERYEKAIKNDHEAGTTISLNDVKKDIRKAFKKY